jgi:peptidyl-prolyl cis-trans isomerase C
MPLSSRIALAAAAALTVTAAASAQDPAPQSPTAGQTGAAAAPNPAGSPQAASPKPAAPRAGAPKAGGADVLATVNGAAITQKDFDEAVQRLPEQYKSLAQSPQGRRQILDNLILTRLLSARARSQGLHKDAKVRAQVEAFAEQAAIMAMMQRVAEKAAGSIPEGEARAYFNANPTEFQKSQEQVRASHILVETEAQAAKVREEVVGGKDFAEVAKAESKDEGSAQRGGDLGFFARGRMVPEFADAAFALQNPGDISPVVKSQFGFHVIKLLERKPAEQSTFVEARDRIEGQLREEKQQAAVDQYVKAVRESAKIEVNEEKLGK